MDYEYDWSNLFDDIYLKVCGFFKAASYGFALLLMYAVLVILGVGCVLLPGWVIWYLLRTTWSIRWFFLVLVVGVPVWLMWTAACLYGLTEAVEEVSIDSTDSRKRS